MLCISVFWRRLVVGLFLLAASHVSADFERDYDDRPWAETETSLPPFPRQENLLPFNVSASTSNRFFIDGESISVGADGVVRYTLVVVSSAGARNVSYEGLRCAVAERRIYALGRADGTWSRARSNQWSGFQGIEMNRHHAALFHDYFCTRMNPVRDAESARQTLRSGGYSPERN